MYLTDTIKPNFRNGAQIETRRILATVLALTINVVNVFSALGSQSQDTDQSKSRTIIALTPEVLAQQSIGPDQTLAYPIKLNEGQLVLITLNQAEVDVAASVFAPNTKKIIEMDDTSIGIESVPIVAQEQGLYTLEVRSVSPIKSTKRFEITIHNPRVPTALESKWFSIELTATEGAELFEAGKFTDAALKLKDAAAAFHSIDQLSREASTLYSIGAVYDRLDQKQTAIDYYEKALALSRQLRRPDMEASALAQAAYLYSALGRKHKALEYDQLALRLFRLVHDRLNEAATLNNMGLIYDDVGEKRSALNSYNQSLRLMINEFGEREALRSQFGLLYNNIGKIYLDLGDYEKAFDFFDKSLDKAKGNSYAESLLFNNIGQGYLGLGDEETALSYFERARSAGEKIPNERREEIISLSNIGHVQNRRHDFDSAIATFSKAEKLAKAADDEAQLAVATHALGDVYSQTNNNSEALKKFKAALPMTETVGDVEGQAVILNSMGDLYLEGDLQTASQQFRKAYQLAQSKGIESARDYALYGLAKVARKQGQFLIARKTIESVIRNVEGERDRVFSKTLRASFLASKRLYYDFGIDLLMEMHDKNPAARYDILAFNLSERMRARSLLELLNESRTEITRNVPAALLEKKRRLSERLNSKSDSLLRLPATNTEELTITKKEIAELTTQLQRVESEIIGKSPSYAALKRPTPLVLQSIQTRILDSSSLLLQYTITGEKTYLWAIDSKQLKSYVLPRKEDIEDSVLAFRTLISDAAQWSREVQSRPTPKCAETTVPAVASNLSQMLLGPVATVIADKRLIIVSDGALQYLPFGALPIPEAANSQASYTPLVSHNEIVTLPSASTMALVRKNERHARVRRRSAILFADPVFDRTDDRIQQAGLSKPQPRTVLSIQSHLSLKRAAESPSSNSSEQLPRLRATRDEADQIAIVINRKDIKKALDFDANRSLAISGEMTHYQYVHFATHGWLDPVHPELSGLVLSLFDQKGEAQQGFVQLQDIYGMKLNADLVVLSACKTGLAKDVRGEGLIGLTRGFMYSGSPRVVVSLWSVSDVATAELMKRFYTQVFTYKKKPAQALRLAQKSMFCDQEFNNPYYWAAFTFQGEWR